MSREVARQAVLPFAVQNVRRDAERVKREAQCSVRRVARVLVVGGGGGRGCQALNAP